MTKTTHWHSFDTLRETTTSKWVCFEKMLRGNGDLGIVPFRNVKFVDFEDKHLWKWTREMIQGTGNNTKQLKHVIKKNNICIAWKKNKRKIINFHSIVSILQTAKQFNVVIINGTQTIQEQIIEMQSCRIFISQFGSIAFKALFLPTAASFILLEDKPKNYYNPGIEYDLLWKFVLWIETVQFGLDEDVKCKDGMICDVPINANNLQSIISRTIQKQNEKLFLN